MNNTVLDIQHLAVSFYLPQGEVKAVRGVSLSLEEGEIVVLAGESGCGKSALCRSIVKLLPRYAVVKSGHIVIGGHDITQYTEKDMQAVRGLEVGMVFQNPLTTLNPVLSIGTQLAEALKRRTSAGARELNEQAVGLLEQVGIQQGKERLAMMPAEFSGGQRQRITLAIALASQPRLLIADEPTTALDVTVQLRMIDLLRNLAKNSGLTVLLVTHDLGVAARIADRVGIMYAGKLVEIGTTEEIFSDPRHPYTQGLLAALPSAARVHKRLRFIPGMPPDMLHVPAGDAFANRNPRAMAIDYEEEPPFFSLSRTHRAATWTLDPRAPEEVRCPDGRKKDE